MTDQTLCNTDNLTLISSWSLVLDAVNIPHQIIEENSGFSIIVMEEYAEEAQFHLQSFIHENTNWPPVKTAATGVSSSIQPPSIILMSALAIFYFITGPWSMHSIWFQNGAGDAGAILQKGQYYRLVTALTLHADLTHLLGNFFLGGVMVHFLCKSAGPGIGFLAILFSATLGNFINVVLHGDDHLFVGFSTAVFASVGIMSMLSYHSTKGGTGNHALIPLMAGAALLAMTGSSGERTDLGAHLFGLFSGFAAGRILSLAQITQLRSSLFLQTVLFLFSSTIIFFCWYLAMATTY